MKVLGYSSYSNESQYASVLPAFKAVSEVVEKAQQNGDYGTDLQTLLIFYNFETDPDEFSGTNFLQKKIEVQRYNAREKSLRVNVFVGFDELTNINYQRQIAFYYETTMKVVETVIQKFARRPVRRHIELEKLYMDIKKSFLREFDWLKG